MAIMKVSSKYPDDVLYDVQKKLPPRYAVYVDGFNEFQNNLGIISDVTILDLIGHSVGNEFFLCVGDSSVGVRDRNTITDDPQVGWNQTLQSKEPLCLENLREIRLLGCLTAWRERGWNAMKAIEQRLNVKVSGTKDWLVPDDFDRRHGGFKNLDKLVGTDDTAYEREVSRHGDPPDPPEQERLGITAGEVFDAPGTRIEEVEWFGEYRHWGKGIAWPRYEIAANRRDLIACVGGYDAKGGVAPRLVLPEDEYWIPVNGTGTEYRVVQRLHGNMLVVYSQVRGATGRNALEHGVMFRVQDGARLTSLLGKRQSMS